MIDGVGVDIVEIARIRKAIETWGGRFLNRVFNPQEILYAHSHQFPYPHFAGRFAAKEAIYKAMGMRSLSWKDITIINAPDGKPVCHLKFSVTGHIHLSISHSRHYAVANAIFVREVVLSHGPSVSFAAQQH